jgi:NAD(P)-dependent dehydrogenase (short-subunit alcohol dehydrogenase family)
MPDRHADNWSPPALKIFDLSGKTALVTGSSRGLGFGIALTLAEAGSNLALWDVLEPELNKAGESIGKTGVEVHTEVVDVTDEEAVSAGIDRVVKRYGKIDVVVNNAGVTSSSPFESLDEEDWRRVLDVNMGGIFRCSKWAARHMIAHGAGGSIINIASISGLVGNRGGNNSHYCATKGGVIALTRSLAVEWAPHDIRVNAIAPGYFVTPMTDRLKERDADFYQELIDRVPLGRFGEPPDLAGAVIYLASPASSFVTGNVLVVDGGYTAW